MTKEETHKDMREKLKEEFETKFGVEYPFDNELTGAKQMFNWFYSKLEEVRSEDKRVFRDNIISKVQIFEADLQSRLGVNDTFEIEDKIEAVRNVLDLIKQD